MTRIDLEENGQPREVRLSPQAGMALAASRLATAVPTMDHEWWLVGPANRVGVAKVAGVELRIKPKLSIARLFFLLGFARDGSWWRDEDVEVAEAADVLAAVAEAFARQADRAIGQGLLQGYRVTEESSTVLRGRLREADQMRRRFGLALPMEVRFDEYTVDIAENQLLRGAAERLLRMPGLPSRVRRRLMRQALLLSEVSLLAAGSPLPRWQPTRLNARYQNALHLAELILRASSVENADGTVVINGFMLDMPRLFEDFVTRALGRALTAYGGVSKAQDRWHLDVGRQIAIRPDLVWYDDLARVGAVVDAKYKADKPAGFPDADLYQLLAYCTALGLPRGHLVYAKGNEQTRRHIVRNADVEIVQHALDLDRTPDQLLSDIDDLAESITGAEARAATSAIPSLGSVWPGKANGGDRDDR